MENNIQEVIIICGVQEVCKGNRATGEMLSGPVAIPVCEECYEHLEQAYDRFLTQRQQSGSLE